MRATEAPELTADERMMSKFSSRRRIWSFLWRWNNQKYREAKAERPVLMDALVLAVKGVMGVRRIHGITLHLIANLEETSYLESDDETLEQSVTHTNHGGLDGAPGQPGMQQMSRLEDGNNGRNGSVQIFIQGQNEEVSEPFASPFRLELFDFDVIDGNEDGIFEFGEEIDYGIFAYRTLVHTRLVHN